MYQKEKRIPIVRTSSGAGEDLVSSTITDTIFIMGDADDEVTTFITGKWYWMDFNTCKDSIFSEIETNEKFPTQN